MHVERMNLEAKEVNKFTMTFEELLQKDTYDAFRDYQKVATAKESGLIPKSYNSIFKDKCKCGSDMIITNNLTTIQCCNPRCYIKLGHMLNEMFTRFGIKGFGPATCIGAMKEAINTLEIPSHLELFSLDRFDLPLAITESKLDDFEYAKALMLSKQYTLSDLVSRLGLPGIGEKAHAMFEEYSHMSEVDEAIERLGGISRFLSDKGIYAPMMCYNFRTYITDIILAQIRFDDQIRMRASQNIEIVMTGYLSPNGVSMSKDEYLELLNRTGTLSDGTPVYGFKASKAVKSVPYVVADYETSNRNYREGAARGVIISSTDLLNQVKELVKEVENSAQ